MTSTLAVLPLSRMSARGLHSLQGTYIWCCHAWS
jgi:hypothetical protein